MKKSKKDIKFDEAVNIRLNISRLIQSLKSERARAYWTDMLREDTPHRSSIRGVRSLLNRVQRFIREGEKLPQSPEERKARSLQRLKEYKTKMKQAKQNDKTVEELI